MKTLKNRRDTLEIFRRLESVRPDSPRRWGSMTAHAMICHLSDGVRLYIGERPVPPVKVPLPRAVMKWGALWMPVQWPHGFKTAPEMDQAAGGTRPGEFERDVAELLALTTRFVGPPGKFSSAPHPHFGVMTPREWLRLGYLHADHHLRQFGA